MANRGLSNGTARDTFDAALTQVMCTGMWDSRESAERYGAPRGALQQLARFHARRLPPAKGPRGPDPSQGALARQMNARNAAQADAAGPDGPGREGGEASTGDARRSGGTGGHPRPRGTGTGRWPRGAIAPRCGRWFAAAGARRPRRSGPRGGPAASSCRFRPLPRFSCPFLPSVVHFPVRVQVRERQA
jgi:hypothetical protein